jgi:hypothetical protein
MEFTDRNREGTEGEGGSMPAARYQALLASLQELSGIGAWSYDVATDETWWGDQAKRVCGIDASRDPPFATVAGRYTDTDGSELIDAFRGAVEDRDSFDTDVRLSREGITRRTVRVRCKPTANENGGRILYGTVQDIAEEIRREQRINVLRETSQQLNNATSRQVVADIVADASKNILGLVNTTVRLIDGSDGMLRTVVATEECVERAGERPDYPVSEATPAARTYRTGDPELHPDHEATEDQYDRGELNSGLYVPIGSHGVLSAGDIVRDAFDERDLEAASLLGQLGAEAITRIGLARRSRAI